jgi:hypothetical protein
MARPSALRFAALLAVLALLLPLAALRDSCADCLWGDSPDCCPPACCPCCVHGPSVLTAAIGGALGSAAVDSVPSPQEDPDPSFHPRDIFHVPKPSRA